MARGEWTSPWQASFGDYLDRRVTVQVTFNTSTLAITNPGLSGTRDAGCLYDRVVIGRVEDGTRRVISIPEGNFSVNRTRLSQNGFSLITDITDGGFTLGTQEPET
jgi:hypothetical protein